MKGGRRERERKEYYYNARKKHSFLSVPYCRLFFASDGFHSSLWRNINKIVFLGDFFLASFFYCYKLCCYFGTMFGVLCTVCIVVGGRERERKKKYYIYFYFFGDYIFLLCRIREEKKMYVSVGDKRSKKTGEMYE